VEIDAAFLALLEGWSDPENIAVAGFAYRAHSAFRAAAQLALTGQVPEAFMVVRGSLECALYANHIDVQASAFDAWIERGESENARRRCKTEFAGKNLFASVRSRDSGLAEIAGRMYDRSIDLGAHPNEAGVMSTLTVEESEAETGFVFSYIAGDALPLRLAIKSVSQVGLMVLDIMCLVFPQRCAEQGIADRLAAVKPKF
jgi:hypothetical protein